MGDFKDLIAGLYKDYEETLAKDNEEGYVRLSQIVDLTADSLREYAQDVSAHEIKHLVQKLKGPISLSPSDLDLLRLCIVGDAESYVNIENSVPEWKNELHRVMVQVSSYTAENPKVTDVLKLQALLRDADRIIDDLSFYAVQKDRVEKFNSAIKHLGPEDRALLVGLLNTKLQSKHY